MTFSQPRATAATTGDTAATVASEKPPNPPPTICALIGLLPGLTAAKLRVEEPLRPFVVVSHHWACSHIKKAHPCRATLRYLHMNPLLRAAEHSCLHDNCVRLRP